MVVESYNSYSPPGGYSPLNVYSPLTGIIVKVEAISSLKSQNKHEKLSDHVMLISCNFDGPPLRAAV